MTSTTTAPTLTETVYEIVSGDHGTDAALAGCSREPASYKGQLSVRESDLRDWGFVYGLAFATARAEEPNQDEALIAERALDAARAVYVRWSNTITERPSVSPLVDEVLRTFEECEEEISKAAYIDNKLALRPLVDSVNRLRSAIGTPCRDREL